MTVPDEGLDPSAFPAEPLRAPGGDEDDGAPMPPEAAAAQEDFLRRAEEAHRELDEGREPNMFDIVDLSDAATEDVQRIALLYLPMDAATAARILLAISNEFPASMCRYDDGGNWLIFERTGETNADY